MQKISVLKATGLSKKKNLANDMNVLKNPQEFNPLIFKVLCNLIFVLLADSLAVMET